MWYWISRPLSIQIPFKEAEILIASGTVSSDLTGFPLMIRLQDLPEEFWDEVNDTGSNIRVYDSNGNKIPHEIVSFSKALQVGRLFCKTDIASAADTSILVRVVGTSEPTLERNSVAGAAKVWEDFEIVVVGDSDKNRVDEVDPAQSGPGAFYLGISKVEEFSGIDNRGVATNGTHLYTANNNILRRRNASTRSILTTNSDPCGDMNTDLSTTVDLIFGIHLDDINGEIFVCASDDSGTDSSAIGVFDSTTLVYKRGYILTNELQSITADNTDFFVVSFFVDNTIYRFNSSFILQETITITDILLRDISGITWINSYPDYLFVVINNGEIYPVNKTTGKAYSSVGKHYGSPPRDIAWDASNNQILTISFDSELHYHDFRSSLTFDWINMRGDPFRHSVPNPSQTFTMVTSASSEENSTDGLLEYAGEVALYLDVPPGEISLRHIPEYDNRLTGVNISRNTPFRIAARLDGGDQDTIQDGVLTYNGSGQTSQPTDLSSDWLWIGESSGVDWVGSMGYTWLRHEFMSTAWLTADYENYHDPENFYEVIDNSLSNSWIPSPNQSLEILEAYVIITE